MKLLFIAPLPNPVNGQSKTSQLILNCLDSSFSVEVININKSSLKNGLINFKRISEILKVFINIWKLKKSKDLIYLSIAESFSGNLRDLFIYFICFNYRKKIVIHLLGGASFTKILSGGNLISYLNRFFISKFLAVIVEGESNFKTFSKIIPTNRIYIVPNFADDFLFVSKNEILEKFDDSDKIQILYLSNLIPGKGYKELASAYIQLKKEFRDKVSISFVGGFESKHDENDFLSMIKGHQGLCYLGKFIDGLEKRDLFCKTHVFCLPTYYPFEGQPISILEAYATGCAVISTYHSGIPSIFSEGVNGFVVDKKSISSLIGVLEGLVVSKDELLKIAIYNRNEALEKYNTTIYKEKILGIFNALKVKHI